MAINLRRIHTKQLRIKSHLARKKAKKKSPDKASAEAKKNCSPFGDRKQLNEIY